MALTRIVVTDYIERDLDWEHRRLAALPVRLEAYQLKTASDQEIVAKIGDASIVIVNMARMSRSVLQNLTSCKLIIRHGVGYDNIDVVAATDMGIQVCYVPDYCSEEVAEQAMMLLLLCRRKFTDQQDALDDSIRKAQWDFGRVGPVHRFSRSRAGLIGCGRVGSLVLRMLRGFGIDVMIHDPYLSKARQAELGVSSIPLDDFLAEADMVSIHSSLTAETHHLIGERELRLMKATAILVNTARGAIVDTPALAQACREGWIAGAGIDVFEKEPPESSFALRGLSNVILTPHLAWYSEEAGWSIREKIMEDVLRALDGRPPRYPVNVITKASHVD